MFVCNKRFRESKFLPAVTYTVQHQQKASPASSLPWVVSVPRVMWMCTPCASAWPCREGAPAWLWVWAAFHPPLMPPQLALANTLMKAAPGH